MKRIFLLFVLHISFRCSVGVRIVKLDVPSSYVDSCRPLILDCEYEFGVKDVGFVLKWYHNNISIYQWIPPRPPYIFSVFKYHINLQFNISDDEKFRHRAIQLQPRSNGMMNYAGQWMCSVSTYQTSDRQIKTMNIIVPEKSFTLSHHDLNFYYETSQVFLVICSVKQISPEPDLEIVIDDNYKILSEVQSQRDENGFFNKSITARVDKKLIPSPSTFNCLLKVNGTNYKKKKQFIYYDQEFDKRASAKFERLRKAAGSQANFSSGVIIMLTLALHRFM